MAQRSAWIIHELPEFGVSGWRMFEKLGPDNALV